ncbi:hypothetical protein C8R45DRAFT_931775 [Mycena sanguinolenta]|nr:hypothetical protein C8R45DRAFT_931775 [Mycena sanguinolenta]
MSSAPPQTQRYHQDAIVEHVNASWSGIPHLIFSRDRVDLFQFFPFFRDFLAVIFVQIPICARVKHSIVFRPMFRPMHNQSALCVEFSSAANIETAVASTPFKKLFTSAVRSRSVSVPRPSLPRPSRLAHQPRPSHPTVRPCNAQRATRAEQLLSLYWGYNSVTTEAFICIASSYCFYDLCPLSDGISTDSLLTSLALDYVSATGCGHDQGHGAQRNFGNLPLTADTRLRHHHYTAAALSVWFDIFAQGSKTYYQIQTFVLRSPSPELDAWYFIYQLALSGTVSVSPVKTKNKKSKKERESHPMVDPRVERGSRDTRILGSLQRPGRAVASAETRTKKIEKTKGKSHPLLKLSSFIAEPRVERVGIYSGVRAAAAAETRTEKFETKQGKKNCASMYMAEPRVERGHIGTRNISILQMSPDAAATPTRTKRTNWIQVSSAGPNVTQHKLARRTNGIRTPGDQHRPTFLPPSKNFKKLCREKRTSTAVVPRAGK